MIKAVIFDIGGVLLRTEDQRPRQQLEARLGLNPGAAEHIVFNSEMGRKAQLGQITTPMLWAWVAEHLRLDDAGLKAFQQAMFAGDHWDEELIALIRQLKERYQMAIISNANDSLYDLLRRVNPIADAFDVIVGSAYEGIMKPDPVIFQRTLQRLNCQPHETVFIDDFAHNVDGARGVGMKAILFQAGIDLAGELKKVGVSLG